MDSPDIAPLARFDDLLAGTSLQFSGADRKIEARDAHEVADALQAVEEAVEAGNWAFGFLAYEAAAGLDPGAVVHDPAPGLPLLWFGIAERPDADPGPLPTRPSARNGAWSLDQDRAAHAEAVGRVHEAIAAGDTYQANLTTRLRSPAPEDPYALYGDLARRQQGAYCAYLDLDRWAVLSASPERFLHWDGDVLTAAPMKGTAPRGATPQTDAAARADLLSSEKDRAENVMIVDLIRNDLARVSRPGTVEVRELLAAEQYPTVWQLTSTVTSRTRPGTTLLEVMAAMFPCGSVTGAPKLSTMQLIRQLEPTPRGVYCGAIGYLAPGPRRRASFNVAIRTVLVDREQGRAVYGVGGGVTWASTADAEFAEMEAKARVLQPAPALLETFALIDSVPRHLERHLARLQTSAEHFGFTVDRDAILREVAALRGTALVRLRLQPEGTVTLEPRPLEPSPQLVRLAVDTVPIDPASPYVQHKTTHRDHCTSAWARHPEADDVVLVNPSGNVTETTVASIAARIDGTWCTPPLTEGCLPGIGRALAVERDELLERPLSVDELHRAEQIALISSARGWRRAMLTRTARRSPASPPSAPGPDSGSRGTRARPR